jgi:hypothetical protein
MEMNKILKKGWRLMSRKKLIFKILFWILGVIMATTFLIFAVPLVVFFFYHPYTIAICIFSIVVYITSLLLFSILYFVKKKNIYQTITFILFFLPILLFRFLLFLVAIGAIHLQ